MKKSNEETTRREFLEEVLSILGFSYFSNLSLPTSERTQTPDYLLFADEQTKEKVFNENLEVQFSSACGLLEAKKIFSVLDAKFPGEPRFPHQQVRDYLESATDYSGTPYFRWAILASGNEWRLYSRDSHPSAYFVFQLCDDNGHFCSIDDLKLFLTLFGSSAFVESDGVCLLDEVRAESIQFQTELEASIRRRIYGVVTRLANGFWNFEENQITQEDLPALYETCLIFLYRLLFVLYAEARGLLPVDSAGPGSNAHYRNTYSLQRLIPKLNSAKEFTSPELPKLYEELLDLFSLINGDKPKRNEACGVYRYNGGLFSPHNHPQIERWRIGDKALAGVLRELMFAPVSTTQRQFNFGTIDYADLEVRQLGDIYEALLGGRLDLGDTEDLVLMGEHAALQETGTFYTPDWVVQFLVERTLRPLIEEVNCVPEVAKSREEGSQNNSFAIRVLGLKIVDPAMGSGHFLVRATEWLAYEIVRHQTTAPLAETALEADVSATTAFWRRRVVEACIFGVDLNPLAVELAKLSLWLTCIASDEPLSFLDHHLREGNALIAAPFDRLPLIPSSNGNGKLLEFGSSLGKSVSQAIKAIGEIEAGLSDSVDKVKTKEKLWRDEVRPALRPYRQLADVWLTALNGEDITQFEYLEMAEFVESGKNLTRSRAFQKHRETVEKTSRRLRSFNWEFEFPNVFFAPDGEPRANQGFDAILGNPPYISTQTSSEFGYVQLLHSLFNYSDDLYMHFVDKGFRLLRSGGYFGFIISDTFFTLASKALVRDLLQRNSLRYLVQCDPFDATVDAAMFVCAKDGNTSDNFVFIQARYGTETSEPEIDIRALREKLLSFTAAPKSFVAEGNEWPVFHSAAGCLRIHKTSCAPYRHALKGSFFEPTDACISLYNRIMTPWKAVLDEWWEQIDSAKSFAESRDGIERYQASLTPGAITVVGLISEGAQGMRTGNNGKFLGYPDGSIDAQLVKNRWTELSGIWSVLPKFKNYFAKGMEDHSGNIPRVIDVLREHFEDKALGLKRGEIYRVVPNDCIATESDFKEAFKYRAAELMKLWQEDEKVSKLLPYLIEEFKGDVVGISNALLEEVSQKRLPFRRTYLRNGERYSEENKYRIAAIYSGIPGKRSWVPYRKGDAEGHRWLTRETLLIDWSVTNVRYLQDSSDSRWQGTTYFFQPGVTWTLHANHAPLKARLQPQCVFDASGSRLTPAESLLSPEEFLAILNSDLFSFIVKKFVKNTQDYEINDLRMAPLVMPDQATRNRLQELGRLALEAKQVALVNAQPSGELIFKCETIAASLANAPAYLRPDSQIVLMHSGEDCLEVVERAINWTVEKLYAVEGLGPFDQF